MLVVYSFIGKLPNYIIDTVYQTRLFFDGDIYLILDDLNNPHLEKLKEFNVKLINYGDVIDKEFLEICKKRKNKISVINGLGDRKLLFLRSMERFFLLQNLIQKENLENILFLELDNLIYDDPGNWEEELKENCYLVYVNSNMISSGIMFVKDLTSIKIITNNLTEYVKKDQGFVSEMKGNWLVRDKVYFLPTHWKDEKYNELSYRNYSNFGKSIFDGLSIGWYFLGPDPFQKKWRQQWNNGNKKNPWGEIDYTKYKYEWIKDERGRKRPYFIINNEKILINNLHIHSKNLKAGLSK